MRSDNLLMSLKFTFVGGSKSNKSIPYFTPNWHLHNAFSMGVLKHFSDVDHGPIIAVHSSNDVFSWPPTPECQKRVKGAWSGSRDSIKNCSLNANNFVAAKDTNIKFGVRAPRERPHINPKRNFWKSPCDPKIFGR